MVSEAITSERSVEAEEGDTTLVEPHTATATEDPNTESVSRHHESGISSFVDTNDLKDNIRDIIHHLTWLIKCKYAPDVGLHEAAINIFDVLLSCAWETKIVLILAAFMVNYGEFSLVLMQRRQDKTPVQELCTPNKDPLEPTGEELSSSSTPLSNLVKTLLEVGTVMVKYKKERDDHGITDLKPEVIEILHTVTYKIIKIVVSCSSHMESIKTDIGYTTSESEIKQQVCFLKELLDTQKSVTDVMSTTEYDGDQNLAQIEYQDLHHFATKVFTEENSLNGGEIGLEELSGDSASFLISDLNVKVGNFDALIQAFQKIHDKKEFKVVWIPMVDQTREWTNEEEKCFSALASAMPWYWCHPSKVTKVFSSYIAEEWEYHGETSLVVLDEKAKVINNNALPVVETWGASAFPFSREAEANIIQNWTIENMVKDLEILEGDRKSEIVCLYGGDDHEMTNSFTQCLESINEETSSHIRAIYVGTKGKKENLQNIIHTLEEKKIKCLSESMVSCFWNRLTITLKSRSSNSSSLDEEVVTKQLMTLLGYSSEGLWTTMMYNGSTEFIKSTGTNLLQCLEGFTETNSKFESTNELWESLTHDLKEEICTVESRNITHTANDVRDLFKNKHEDIYEVLCKLFTKEKALNGGKIGLKKLEGKYVSFLMTEADVSVKELTALQNTYNAVHIKKNFEIIWIPIEDPTGKWTVEKLAVANSMPWKWCKPSVITGGFSAYIKEEWYSQRQNSLIVLDKKGGVISGNAFEMVELMGAMAFPFSREKEAYFSINWTMEVMLTGLDLPGIQDRSQILLVYGGNDDVMIQSFLKLISRMEKCAAFIYAGTTRVKGNVRRSLQVVRGTKRVCLNGTSHSMFWRRLQFINKCKTAYQDPTKPSFLAMGNILNDSKGLWFTMTFKDHVIMFKERGPELLTLFRGFNSYEERFNSATSEKMWDVTLKFLNMR